MPHIGPPDVPQSEEPAINIISGKEKRAPILKHQTHWKVLISSNEAIPTELIEEYYGLTIKYMSPLNGILKTGGELTSQPS